MSELDLTPEEELLLIEVAEHGGEYRSSRPNLVMASLARKRLVEWNTSEKVGRGSTYYWYQTTRLGDLVYNLMR